MKRIALSFSFALLAAALFSLGWALAPRTPAHAQPSQLQSSCGDGRCSPPEDCHSCPSDCGNCCGDGRCAPPEDCRSCPNDCC